MTEQGLRSLFFAKTGRVATSEPVEYQAFLWGVAAGAAEYKQDALRYRQLKSWIKGSSPAMARVLVMKQGQYIVQETPKDLDAAIDRARGDSK